MFSFSALKVNFDEGNQAICSERKVYMKKTGIIILSLLVIGGVAVYFTQYPKLEIVSGYNAKIMCSCLFVSGFDQEVVEEVDLGFGPLWLASNEVDFENKTVYTSVMGMHPKKAIFRDGMGCSLIHNEAEPMAALGKIGIQDLSGWPEEEIKGSAEMQNILQKAFDKDGENLLNTRAVVVVKNGEIVGEAYGPGINKDTPLLGWSMAKSITAILTGILAQEGYWDLSSNLPISDWKGTEKEKITLANALNMSTGLEWEEEYGSVSSATKMLYSSSNMGATASSYEPEHAPGEFWEYSSGTTNIISYAMASAFPTDKDYIEFPYKSLFKPLGTETFVLETDASGHFVGSSYGYASARDWAKMGLLFLNKGNMYGEQIVDSSWVEFCATPVSQSDGVYGGQVWFPHARGQEGYKPIDYALDGFQGQIVSVHPEDNMVIVRLGVMYDETSFDFGAWTKEIREILE